MSDRFKGLADEFEARIRAAGIKPATEVIIVAGWTDLDGNPLPDMRHECATSVAVVWHGNPEGARRFAEAAFLDQTIGNMRGAVADITCPHAVLTGYTLEINHPPA